jgi:hypothetical protein
MRTLAGFGQHLAGGNPCTAYGGNPQMCAVAQIEA